MRKIFFLLGILPVFALAQKKQITLEDIYKNRTFMGEQISADFGQKSKDPVIKTSELKDETGKSFGQADDIIYSSEHPNIVLMKKGNEQIYRRSSKAYVYLYDTLTKKLVKLSNEKVLHPSLSPDGSKVAFVENNNLVIFDIASGNRKAVTTDGKWNYIINGNCDWVYEEEFSFTQAFDWSPKGNYLAYYRFDETNVKEYEFTKFDNSYNSQYSYKYPKAGEQNSKVEIHIYDVQSGKNVMAKFDTGDIYIPRIKWSQNDNALVVYWMNRHQDDLKLLLTNAQTGNASLLYEEKNKSYVEIDDDWWFLKDGSSYLYASEKNGWRQLFLNSMDGKNSIQVTQGKFDIAEVCGVDEQNKLVYFLAGWPRPMDRNLFVSSLDGKQTKQLTQDMGWHRIVFNNDFTRYYDFYSTINTPAVVTVNKIVMDKKKQVSTALEKTVGQNDKLNAKLNEYQVGKSEFIRIPNSKGDTLNGWMLKPYNFDPAKKYPVLFCNYGGPGSQQVVNRFGAVSFWHQLLAERGFIIVSVDNTGTGFRGEEFKKKTYLQLGKFEIEDQIDAAKWLANFSYVDKNNIGHWGWSYGGFMSALAITKGNDAFSAAVSVAPVTNWRYYDNIYTERYMRTPQENPKGYDDNSPINFTDKIKGKYLLIHGTADDNVHFQNSVQMVKSLVKSNVDFDSFYYPDKNHGISGGADNTTFHLWSKMTNWITDNLGNSNSQRYKTTTPSTTQKAF
jgi:dipeptidyl-peptidase 4